MSHRSTWASDEDDRVDAEDLAFAGVARQAELIRAGEVSSRELVELYLDRIERLDPQLNAFTEVLGERALAEAESADASRGERPGAPLLGVPLAIKDVERRRGLADLVRDEARSSGRPAAADCESVAPPARRRRGDHRARRRCPSSRSAASPRSEGWGRTRNPWDPSRSTGGSSGGSAAAVAAGPGRRGVGDRRRRLDPHPGCVLRPVRAQAPARPGADGSARPLARPVRGRLRHPDGRRHRALPRRGHRRRR